MIPVIFVMVGASCSSPGGDLGHAPGGDDSRPDAGVEDAGGYVDEDAESSFSSIELGEVKPGEVASFDAPEGTLGFNIVGLPSTATSESIGVRDLVGPDGTRIVDDGYPEGAGFQMVMPGVAATAVPRGSKSVAMRKDGRWTFSFMSSVPLRAWVHLQHRPQGRFGGGALDLHIYIPRELRIHDPGPEHEVTAANAPTDPAVAKRLDVFFGGLESLFGIGRGKVTFHEIGAEHLDIDMASPAMGLATSEATAGGDGQAMHVIWTSKLHHAGDRVWGVSPGIPGGAVRAGHPSAAVVLSITPDFNAKGDGLTMLHETGHFIGLQHTTELDGINADPLADTEECNDISLSAFHGCPDKNNLMFPLFFGATRGGNGLVVSEEQRSVVRGSPIYKAMTTRGTMQRGQAQSSPHSMSPSGDVVGTTRIRPCGHGRRR